MIYENEDVRIMKTTLSQNEINSRSARFAQNWKDTIREEADAQAFLMDFGFVCYLAPIW